MLSIEDLKTQQQLLADLRASGDPAAAMRADALQGQYYREQMGLLSEDVYESARGEGQPPAGWVRASENLPMLRQQMPQLAGMPDDAIRDMLKPKDSGFRAEIYMPDPAILGPGYKPTTAFKGSNGEVLQADGSRRETGQEDFGANNFPQTIGQETDYYDRAMRSARELKRHGADVDYADCSPALSLESGCLVVRRCRYDIPRRYKLWRRPHERLSESARNAAAIKLEAQHLNTSKHLAMLLGGDVVHIHRRLRDGGRRGSRCAA